MSSLSPYDKRDPKAMVTPSAGVKNGNRERKRKTLNSKQVRYCIERSNGKTQGEAYAIAYRDTGTAYKNGKLGNMVERNPLIKNHIAELIQARSDVVNIAVRDAAKELAIDKYWVLKELVENVKMAKQAVEVCDAIGTPIGVYKQNLTAANRALELIGKELGMFIERKEIRIGELHSLTDEQLDQLVAATIGEIPAQTLVALGFTREAETIQGESARVLPTVQ